MACGLHQTNIGLSFLSCLPVLGCEGGFFFLSTKETYTFMEVDGVFTRDDVGDGGSCGGLFGGGFGFGRHFVGLSLSVSIVVVVIKEGICAIYWCDVIDGEE